MKKLLLVVVLLAAWIPAFAKDAPAPQDKAPTLEDAEWLTPSDARTLAELRGQVVVLLVHQAANLDDERAVQRWADMRAGYLNKRIRFVAVLAKKPAALPEGFELDAVVASASDCGSPDGAWAALVAVDGSVVWSGPADELPESDLPKLARKTKFVLRDVDASVGAAATEYRKGRLASARTLAATIEHEDATHIASRVTATLEYWQQQADRATKAANPAEVAAYRARIAKHFADAPEGVAATEALKTLKRDKAANKEIKAAAGYAKLRPDLLRTKGKRKKIDALVKKAERFAKKNPGTHGGARAARLAASLKADPAISALRAFIAKEGIKASGSTWRVRLPKPPIVEFMKSRKYVWVLETSEGKVEVVLFPDGAPMHVSNLVYLTELKFFDGLTFHRVIPGFMAQGGCPAGSGSGNPGYGFDGEFESGRKHDGPGILSAAHSGPGTDGSQFFLTFRTASHLDGKHTVYGQARSGLDTLKKLEKFGTGGGTPTKRLTITAATIQVE